VLLVDPVGLARTLSKVIHCSSLFPLATRRDEGPESFNYVIQGCARRMFKEMRINGSGISSAGMGGPYPQYLASVSHPSNLRLFLFPVQNRFYPNAQLPITNNSNMTKSIDPPRYTGKCILNEKIWFTIWIMMRVAGERQNCQVGFYLNNRKLEWWWGASMVEIWSVAIALSGIPSVKWCLKHGSTLNKTNEWRPRKSPRFG
jgi:hypothetical protein